MQNSKFSFLYQKVLYNKFHSCYCDIIMLLLYYHYYYYIILYYTSILKCEAYYSLCHYLIWKKKRGIPHHIQTSIYYEASQTLIIRMIVITQHIDNVPLLYLQNAAFNVDGWADPEPASLYAVQSSVW